MTEEVPGCKHYAVIVNNAKASQTLSMKESSKRKLNLIYGLVNIEQSTLERKKYRDDAALSERLWRFINYQPLPADDPSARHRAVENIGSATVAPASVEWRVKSSCNDRSATTCTSCYNSKVKCERKNPCRRCLRLGIKCVSRIQRTRGNKRRGILERSTSDKQPPGQRSEACINDNMLCFGISSLQQASTAIHTVPMKRSVQEFMSGDGTHAKTNEFVVTAEP